MRMRRESLCIMQIMFTIAHPLVILLQMYNDSHLCFHCPEVLFRVPVLLQISNELCEFFFTCYLCHNKLN